MVGDALPTNTLFQSETDGSSFPNGGLRVTHRAAAFLSWDKHSPPYIVDDTMFLPAAFVTHNGQALDHKTPLLRSEEAICKQGLRLLRNLGDTTSERVVANLGWEQEYFLIDREMFLERPDLVMSGRTLFGAQAPRNQSGSEQYFGVPYPRAKAFMEDISEACWELNIALKVNHNEVAPAQHELCPVFTLGNVATDQNMVCMGLMDTIAARHGLKCLMHEKPFQGVNGSGKHANWSVGTDTGKYLFNPGSTEEQQGEFFAFTAALTSGLARHGDILRVAAAHAGNDHRLGAQEAPPAIISMYTGDLMEDHIRSIVGGGPLFG
jgi:glutamine synthetase